MTGWISFARRLFMAAVLGIFLYGTSGCQLFVVPVMVLGLTFQLVGQLLTYAIVIPIKLLPVAIKYAPLALLFIDQSMPEPVYYIEWLEKKKYPYRVQEFRSRDGKTVSAIVTDSDALCEWFSTNPRAQSDFSALVLTEEAHRAITVDELAITWEHLKVNQRSMWIVGKPVDGLRTHSDIAYI